MNAFKSFGASFLAICASLAALKPETFLPFLPSEVGRWVAAVLSGAAAIVHFWDGITKLFTPAATTAVQKVLPLLLIATVMTMALGMISCVSATTPDGTRTTSFAPTSDQLGAVERLINAIKGKAVGIQLPTGPIYGPDPAPVQAVK